MPAVGEPVAGQVMEMAAADELYWQEWLKKYELCGSQQVARLVRDYFKLKLISHASGGAELDGLVERLERTLRGGIDGYGQSMQPDISNGLVAQAATALRALATQNAALADHSARHSAELQRDTGPLLGRIKALTAQVAKYQARLEIDHAFKIGDGDDQDLVRYEIPEAERDSFPDGITARDCTIELAEEHNAELKSRIAKLEGGRDEIADAMRSIGIERLSEQAKAESELSRMRVVLRDAVIALNDWIAVYAPDETGDERVAEAQARIGEYGTLAYVAHINEAARPFLQVLEDRKQEEKPTNA